MAPQLPSSPTLPRFNRYRDAPEDSPSGSGSREPSPPHYATVVQRDDASVYTLATIARPGSPNSVDLDADPLLNSTRSKFRFTYGTIPRMLGLEGANRRLLLNAALKMAALFVVSSLVLGGTLWIALPTLDDEDRPDLRIPRSFAQLQALNALLKKYRDIYPLRIFVCFVTTYLFLQAFSLPGSMYLSILGGAVWGVPIALLLCCTCVACGATLCYFISSALGPALLSMPKWRARIESWVARVEAQRSNLLSYLIVLRIAPFPPHWVINVLAPHMGVKVLQFWISTWLGIFGVTVIHTTIGSGLDEMTSASDFHLFSVRNALGLGAIVLGALLPVGLRYVFKRRTGISLDNVTSEDELLVDENGDRILAQGPAANELNKYKPFSAESQLILLSDSESEGDGEIDLLEEDDEVLEAVPALVPTKGK